MELPKLTGRIVHRVQSVNNDQTTVMIIEFDDGESIVIRATVRAEVVVEIVRT